MTARKKKPSPRSRSSSNGPQLTIRESSVDLFWKWASRVIIAFVPVLVGLWYVFGWYNGVEAVKSKVGELTHRVEAMWTGQTELLNQMKKIEKTVSKEKRE